MERIYVLKEGEYTIRYRPVDTEWHHPGEYIELVAMVEILLPVIPANKWTSYAHITLDMLEAAEDGNEEAIRETERLRSEFMKNWELVRIKLPPNAIPEDIRFVYGLGEYFMKR